MDTNQNTGGQSSQNPQRSPQLSWSQPQGGVSQNKMLGTGGQQNSAQKSSPSKPGNPQGKKFRVNAFGWLVIGLIVGIAIGWAWFGRTSSTEEKMEGGAIGTSTGEMAGTGTGISAEGTPSAAPSSAPSTAETGTAPVMSENASVTAPSPQSAGMSVEVSNVASDAPVWAVVYEDADGKPGSALGAARFTPDRTSGTIDLLRTTLPNLTYFVGLTADAPDHTFSIKTNQPLVDASGNRILTQFTAQ